MRVLFTFLLLYFLFRFIYWVFKRYVLTAQTKKAPEVFDASKNQKENKINDKGEYVDYEEIKD